MDRQQSDSCAICSKQPQDMLLLQCSHNLCLDCATQLFAASHQQYLQCEICFVQTLLDQQTINCLSSLAIQVNHAVSRKSQPYVPRPPKQIKQLRGLQCFQHKEKALYYCFDCQNGSICSECILGPTHSGHKVLTVKKATKILAQNLIGISKQLEELKNKIDEDAQWVRIKKEDLTKQLAQKQQRLKLVFDDIIRQVTTRYNQLSTQLERSSMRGIQILDGSLNSMNQKLEIIQTTIQENTLIIRQNDSQKILRRFTQLQLQKDSYKPEMPTNLPHNSLYLCNEDSIFMEIESLMKKLSWDSMGSQRQKENRSEFNNIPRVDASIICEQRQKNHYPQFYVNHLQEKDFNQSVNNYSGIKMSSRRLQLSRSMNNATNIINKLQERIRK